MTTYISGRGEKRQPVEAMGTLFGDRVRGECDALFLSARRDLVVGICGLPFRAPVIKELRKGPLFFALVSRLRGTGESLLVDAGGKGLALYCHGGGAVSQVPLDDGLAREMLAVIRAVPAWAGRINESGEHVVGLATPSPGPHFFANLLLGNRMGYDHPLQTTPKSVVDRLGRGSFRSHAATQVLATRWDLRQEENGFPCNRQFYLAENGAAVFYSADPTNPSIVSGECVHGQNHTRISYTTACGLSVRRTIFLPRQEKGLPIACEIQRVEVTNDSDSTRVLRLVYTGMFGPSKPGALQEDVLYSTIIMEGGVLFNDNGTVRAVSPRYFPAQDKEDLRFHATLVRGAGGNLFPEEFCLDYNDFVGRGSLERPEGLSCLPNEITRKGPGFFALASELTIPPGKTAVVDNFTGLVSRKANPSFDEGSLEREVDALLRRYESPGSVADALREVREFYDSYSSFFELESERKDFSAYCNRNLPFQVLYQTFVSRSFGQTQKGYREIGFREIQDLFASLYYFNALGESAFAKKLILEWTAQVHEFGFANHNFFWEGKEAGKWSDDALWLHQAVGRYVRLTGDLSILDERVPVAGAARGVTRSVYETLSAAVRYSAEISVGRHGIPLLDRADWNDCLRLDRNYDAGPEKERIWKETGKYESDCTESVMNGFLAVLAIKELRSLALARNDASRAEWLSLLCGRMTGNLRKHAWKGNAYARILFNQYPGFEYAGADGDGIDTDGSGGTFFLNSFSWSVLSGVADEAEIKSMLEVVRKKLKTPFGLKLVSPNDLSRVVPGAASAEYFPGDRENGAVFKHASMMAVSAMLDAAKSVKDRALAEELASEAWRMIDIVYPGRSMTDPFTLAGNPRFCTQYNNSETGENIGPLVSGTATWFILGLLKAYGIELTDSGLAIDPILPLSERTAAVTLRMGKATVRVDYSKPEGFARRADGRFKLTLDGKPFDGPAIPLSALTGEHRIVATFA